MTVEEAFSKNMYRHMKRKGWTFVRLAKESGVTSGHLRSIKNNRRAPRLDTAYLISKALGVTVNDLIRGCD